MFGFVSRKKYDKLNQKYEIELEALKYEFDKYKSFAYRRSRGLKLIDASFKNEMLDEDDVKILELMRVITSFDLCYSNYITKSSKGLIVDTSQVPWDYDELIHRLHLIIEEKYHGEQR